MLKTDKFKDRLLADKHRLEGMIASRRDSSVQHGASSVNDSFSNSGDDEYADAASDTFNQELDMTMLNKYRDRLQNVNAALGRLTSGQFGICVRCHQAISPARLDAIPETSFCRDCEADVEVQD